MPLTPLPAQVDLPGLEHEVLASWEQTKVFARSLERTADRPPWVFYEGPPTTNGVPGTHHVEARAFKDLFCRHRTMTGHAVARRAGWDCHGLPVELAVEKQLGFQTKHDIEAYGIAAFNARCRESVLTNMRAFEQMSERMGYWLDYADAYRTMDATYIESVWWSLQTLHGKGLLTEDHRVAPYCPRCETGLSDHEVAQGYTQVTDPSVYFRLPVSSGPLAALGAHLLVWTTQPWTIYVNTLVAVHPDVTYLAVRAADGSVLVVAEPLVEQAIGGPVEVLSRSTGRELEGTRYERPYEVAGIADAEPPAHYVALADYVTVDSGTGLVGQSPAFGAEDMATARAYGAPVVNPVGRDGRFQADLPVVGGLQVKAADDPVAEDLRARGLLWRREPYVHSYPLCWRCDTALLYYAVPSWYVRTTERRDELLRENASTDWHPETIRDGRYGDWLDNNVDWALSRSRYWGTPLPLWRCEADSTHVTAVGSLAELSELAGHDVTGIDPHRPYIDEVTLPCPTCGAEAHRVPEVIDAWYDAGAMPFAQWGAPHHNEERFEAAYPAQFIAEGLDQTRGWFYTLMAIGTLVFDRSAYESVLCLGIILAEDGRRMSKHLGNILEPMALMERHGADALRWFMVASGSPWGARRVGAAALDEVTRKVLLTTWNTAGFLTLYAGSWEPSAADPDPSARPVLDRWALAELADTVREVSAALDAFDPTRAGRRITAFIDDLSNWYVRRSRRRFWAADPAALATLHECLRTLLMLLAPFTPFLADALWQRLVVPVDPAAPGSVHLSPWPAAAAVGVAADSLRADVALARRLVELGRAARATSGVRTRQPLGRALVGAAGFAELPADVRNEVAEELNVQFLEPLAGELVDVVVKPNFRALGRRFGPQTPQVAAQVSAAAYDRECGTVTVRLDGAEQTLGAAELVVTETPREGWAVASGEGASVALDLAITPELRRAGIAREASRWVNEARKSLGLQVSDRIELWWQAGGETAAALREHEKTLAADTLAVAVQESPPAAPVTAHPAPELGATFWLREAGA